MKNGEIKTNIEVSGIILSEKAVNRICNLQEHDNENIHSCREHIADAICFIGKNFDCAKPEDIQELQDLITNLSFVRDYFNDFKKP